MTRRFRYGFAIVILSVLALAGCDWPMTGYGPEYSSSSPDTSISRATVPNLVFDHWAQLGQDRPLGNPVVANAILYAGAVDDVAAFDATGSANCVGFACSPLWTSPITGPTKPVVASGFVFVGALGRLVALDAAGATNCSGAPKVCAPLWTASLEADPPSGSGPFAPTFAHPPVVTGGIVYQTGGHRLYAFDAAGATNCSGSPKVCAPLWTATIAGNRNKVAVAGGVAYVGSIDENVYAFDAAGITNCAGDPKSCTPLWRGKASEGLGQPVVSGGRVFVSGETPLAKLFAFDAAGRARCNAQRICHPLWRGAGLVGSAAHGVVFAGKGGQDVLMAYDAAGVTNCSGNPVRCTPLWSTSGSRDGTSAIANGLLYSSPFPTGATASDATGTTNCSGTPKFCAALWNNPGGGGPPLGDRYTLAVANKRVYAPTTEGIAIYRLP